MNFESKDTASNKIISLDSKTFLKSFSIVQFGVGALLINVIAVIPFFIFKGSGIMIMAFQYIAPIITGLVIGYWAGKVPLLTIFAIIMSVSGKIIVKLFSGQLGDMGSIEFNIRLVSLILIISILFGFTYLGAKIKNYFLVK